MRQFCAAVLLTVTTFVLHAQTIAPGVTGDSDHDGLSDTLESELLTQFQPQFMVSPSDCSIRPARFVPYQDKPTVQAEDGTIYGQAFPRVGQADQVELHFYHLWRTDCGNMGHNLDAEHVSAIVSQNAAGDWRALYWYAAAHEDTLCDISQLAQASTLGAETRGPRVWISRGKHASFLSDRLCTHSCGSDDCRDQASLAVPTIINLGELTAQTAGATWVDAREWPLADKMRRSDFYDARVARAERLPAGTIAWANPQKRPYQAAILGGNDTFDGIAAGGRATDTALAATDAALNVTSDKTGNALGKASSGTGKSLAKTYGEVKKALGITAKKVGNALGMR